jgi:hypothetical protein
MLRQTEIDREVRLSPAKPSRSLRRAYSMRTPARSKKMAWMRVCDTHALIAVGWTSACENGPHAP